MARYRRTREKGVIDTTPFESLFVTVLSLETQLAVRRLTPTLAVFPGPFVLQLKCGSCTELVNEAAGQAGTVGAVPILFK